MVRLKDICTINPKSPGFQDELTVSFVPMPKVGENGEFDPSEIKTYQEVKKGFTYFQNGDVLFAKITPCMENGKGAIAQSLENGVGFGSTEFHVLRPTPKYVTSKWLFYLLSWQTFRKEAEKNMTGSAGQKRVPKGFLEEYDVDLPDISIQEKRTNTLDKICSLISLRKQQLAKLDELVKARFVEMFGDPISNPMNWVTRPLGDECSIVTGNTPSRKVAEYYGDYIEWIKSDNINTPQAILTVAEEGLSKEGLAVGRAVDAGSILMTCIAGSIGCIGNVAIANRKVAFNQQINGIMPNNNNAWFMYIQLELSKKAIQSSINMALKGILSKGQLSEMRFVFPPIELQNEYGHFAEQTNKSKLTIQQNLDKLKVLKKSLMQEHFG